MGAALVICCLFYIGSVVRKVSYQEQPRAEMRAFFGRIVLGDSKAQVRRTFAAGGTKELKLHPSAATSNRWTFQTPPEFGAGNWNLHLEFDARGNLVAKRIRTNDSVFEKPRESAPADEVAPDWTQPFP